MTGEHDSESGPNRQSANGGPVTGSRTTAPGNPHSEGGARRGSQQMWLGHGARGASRQTPADMESRRGSRHMRDGRDDFSSRVVGSERRVTVLAAVGEEDEEAGGYVVPVMPMPIAIAACMLNFILPGFGSMAASMFVFCCGAGDDMTCREKCGSCGTVFGIGVLQLLLVPIFLIGWVWSCMWGVTFIGMSATYYHGYDDDDFGNDDYLAWEQRRYGNTSRLPTPQVVSTEPYPGLRYDDIRREQEHRRDERRHERRVERNRRSRSRISLTPSNLIYPMRAPSNVQYNSPPPPYKATPSPQPRYISDRGLESRRSLPADVREGHAHANARHLQARTTILTDTILEEDIRT